MPGIVRRPLREPSSITAYVVSKQGRQLSSFAEFTIACFRAELSSATARTSFEPGQP